MATEVPITQTSGEMHIGKADMKLEVVVLPVADVDRAADFYDHLGWRKDADFRNGDARLLQFTPPGSACSIIFGTGITPAQPGSVQFLHLIVSDIDEARRELIADGVTVSEVFHDRTGHFNRFDPRVRASGPDPEHRSYGTFVTFNDSEGNGWILQEITERLPGRIDTAETAYANAADLASAMRRASAAHDKHEKRIGKRDDNWPDWYAQYMVAEGHGQDLPT